MLASTNLYMNGDLKENNIKKRLFIIFIATGLAWLGFQLVVRHVGFISPNLSGSLPYWVFVVSKDKVNLQVGELMTFVKVVDGEKRLLTKVVAGVSGDQVSVKSGAIYINDKRVGVIHKSRQSGKKLTPIENSVIPEGKYFSWTPHRYSFDSRYKEIGLVDYKDIVGRAYVLDILSVFLTVLIVWAVMRYKRKYKSEFLVKAGDRVM